MCGIVDRLSGARCNITDEHYLLHKDKDADFEFWWSDGDKLTSQPTVVNQPIQLSEQALTALANSGGFTGWY